MERSFLLAAIIAQDDLPIDEIRNGDWKIDHVVH